MANMKENGIRNTNRTLTNNESTIIEELNEPSSKDDTNLSCCRCLHRRRVSPLTCLAICFLVLTYNLFGGYLFLAIEGSDTEVTLIAASKPNLSQSQSVDLRSKTVERLWSITEDLNILYKENWTKLAAKELMEFQKVLMKSIKRDGTVGTSVSYDAIDYRWTFAGSFLYALTLITTIGHGTVTPKSTAGKVVAVVYACVGIPLIMVYLSTLGETLSRNFRALYSKICPARFKRRNFHTKADCQNHLSVFGGGSKSSNKRKRYDRQKNTPFHAALNLDNLNGGYHWTCRDHTQVPIFLSLLLIVLYVAAGTFIFHTTEKWNIMDGCFFSFLSLATIGFGNLKPGFHASTVSAKAEDIAVGVCCIYILVGIVMAAMCFNLIKDDMGPFLQQFTLFCTGSPKSRAIHNVQPQEENIELSVVS